MLNLGRKSNFHSPAEVPSTLDLKSTMKFQVLSGFLLRPKKKNRCVCGLPTDPVLKLPTIFSPKNKKKTRPLSGPA